MLGAEVGPEKLQSALEGAIRSCKFFPSIAEIREMAGRSPEMMLKLEQDQAWQFVLAYAAKWVSGSRIVGVFSSDGAEAYLMPPDLPARIAYAVFHCGTMTAIRESDTHELQFVRKQFAEAYERFAFTEEGKPENLHPLAGVEQEELLKGALMRARRVPPDPSDKVVTQTEYWQLCREREKPEDAAARLKREEQIRTIFQKTFPKNDSGATPAA